MLFSSSVTRVGSRFRAITQHFSEPNSLYSRLRRRRTNPYLMLKDDCDDNISFVCEKKRTNQRNIRTVLARCRTTGCKTLKKYLKSRFS
uniref:Secreted protein n=1 Tax=Syphacia muris TaxID=451379 RepID=A0A0N5AK92_9BILA